MERGSGFDDDEDDDEFGSRRDGSSHRGDFGTKVDGRGSSGDQRPSTPRSKHSATEQRRRSKINDRFQILRELIPHNDQKRDKASFLLEVIEYIRFLQEKVNKYESTYPGWTDENAKLMPWVKVYFRSFWKNARNNGQCPEDGMTDPSHAIKNDSTTSGFIFSGKFDDNSIPMPSDILAASRNPMESELSAGVSYKVAEPPQATLYTSVGGETGGPQPQQLISDIDNMASQSQSQWLRSPSTTDCTVAGDVMNEQEELTIDEGTISVSSAYSQGLWTTLTQALQSSGIDLSQANISVQINLGKRANSKRPNATTIMSSTKDQDHRGNRGMGHTSVGSSGEESEQALKRHKLDAC